MSEPVRVSAKSFGADAQARDLCRGRVDIEAHLAIDHEQSDRRRRG
jgi:hypothetical protein